MNNIMRGLIGAASALVIYGVGLLIGKKIGQIDGYDEGYEAGKQVGMNLGRLDAIAECVNIVCNGENSNKTYSEEESN